MSSIVSTLAARLPRKLFVRLIALQYPMFEPELRRLSHFVPADKIAIDVGTWWGPWSMRLARQARRVESFEPNASIYESLREALPDNVVLHNLALSDHRGSTELWSPDHELGTEGRSTLSTTGHEGWVHQDVEIAPLDDFAFQDVGFVKIDVEGHELEVLRGATALLERERPNMMIEVEHEHGSAVHMESVFEFMAGVGYRGTFLKDGSWLPLSALDLDATRSLGEVDHSRGMLRNMLARDQFIHNFLFVHDGATGPGHLSR